LQTAYELKREEEKILAELANILPMAG